MVLDEDILKGIRRGAILLAALLIGVATYRIMHGMFSGREDSAPEVAAPAPETLPGFALGPPTVPPPPPRPGSAGEPVHKSVRRRPARTLAHLAGPVEPVAKVEPESVKPVETPAEAAELVVDQPEDAPAATDRQEEAPVLQVQDDGGDSPKASPRRLRWLRAVGRFLHIVGKNDAPSQALR